jgi:hypothetical protein
VGETFGVEATLDDRDGELADVVALLPGQAGPAHRRLVERGDPLRGDLAGEPLQPEIGGASRRQRDLLLEDDLHERRKALRPVPERRRSEPVDHRGKMGVAVAKLCDALGERLGGQLERHVNLTIQATRL